MTHQHIFVWIIGGRIRIAPDFEIHPRRVERAPCQTFFILADMTIGAVFVFTDGMTHITRNFIAMCSVLDLFRQVVRLVTVGAFGIDVFVHVGACLSVAVKRFRFMTCDARHSFFDPMRIALNPVVLAEIFIAHACAVTCRARIALRRNFLERVSGEQTAARIFGAADVTLRAGRVTRLTARLKRFLHFGMIRVRARVLQIRPIAGLREMQSGGEIFGLVGMTRRARRAAVGRRVADNILMRRFLVRRAAVAAVTADAADFAVNGINECFVADINLFPRFQRG